LKRKQGSKNGLQQMGKKKKGYGNKVEPPMHWIRKGLGGESRGND